MHGVVCAVGLGVAEGLLWQPSLPWEMKRKGRLAGSWTRGVLAEAEDFADTIKSYEGKRLLLCNAMVATHHSPSQGHCGNTDYFCRCRLVAQ